ncbi:MAG: branched-chain amino acid transaminase [Bacteroidales bacterium]|nr:branched-chain amino acid transaminase [Bacteroidales bacterium]
MRTANEMIWFRGKTIPYQQAQINIMNASAQYGINAFEGIRCYYDDKSKQLYAFKLQEHLERLMISAKLLRMELKPNLNIDFLTQAIKEVIKANNLREDIYVKIGLFLDCDGGWSISEPVSAFILPSPKERVFTDKQGLSCCVSSWERISDSAIPPRVKSGANYINSRYAFLEAKMNGYDYPIFLNQSGKVSEGPGACFFIVRDGRLLTPPVTASILESITRQVIIELARNELNIQIEEREIDRTEIYISEEAFFAGTSVELLPVTSIDKYAIHTNKTDSITNRLKQLYFNVVRNRLEKYRIWLTAIH